MSEFVFHLHAEGAPCGKECWSLPERSLPQRTRRFEHDHIFQTELEDLADSDCEACKTIDPIAMGMTPNQLRASGGWS